MKNKRLLIIVFAVVTLLLIPLIAMQLTDEVNWTLFDFLVAAILLLIAGLAIDFIIRKVKNPSNRIALAIAFFIVFLLVWAELAVGIFGTPFGGH